MPMLLARRALLALALAAAPSLAEAGPASAAAPQQPLAPSVEASPPAAGGKGVPANPAVPAGASPAPAASGEPANDPCGGSGRLLATLNRPTVGYSACAVPPGAVVLEEGYQNTVQTGAQPSVVASYPQGFERVGVAPRFELDLIGPSFNRSRVADATTTGYGDLGIGFKQELPQRGRFTYGVDGLFTAATGTGGFSNGGPTETLDGDIAYAASPAIGFGTTLAVASSAGFEPVTSIKAVTGGGTTTTGGGTTAGGGAARYGYFLPSVVVTAQIPNAYQFYAELVGQTKVAPELGGRVFTDFGVQKLLGPFLELDAEYGANFTPVLGSRFHYLGVGAGIRVK